MPICLQVISHVFDDEKALGIMKVLESQINYKLDQPLDIGTPTKNTSLSKLTKKNSFG
jgi:methyl coenzyme M reductase gamma subunit